MTLQDSNDFESFLRNIDQINELVKGLKSSDVSCQEEALENADNLIASLEQKEACTTKINKSVTNTNPSSEIRPLSFQDDSSQNPENFMRLLEKDAEERGNRRKMNEDKANALREKGNKAFARGDYETAVGFYSEGLDQLRDVQTLYTNRAQAFIKLKRYKEAISDCEWALRCNGRCVKAYVHMGKSYLALKNFSESKICYQKILEIEPQRETMVKAYMTQVDTDEKAALQEQVAWKALRDGTEQYTAIPELLKNLSRPNEINLYYCGGLELLSQAIKDFHDEETNPHDQPQRTDAARIMTQLSKTESFLAVFRTGTGQTLFRINNGFSVINGKNIERSCLSQNLKEPCAVDLCLSVIKLWRTVCDGNEPNQLMLMQCPDAREYIVQLLASPVHDIHRECLELLRMYSQTQHGRDLVINNLDLYRTAEALMGRIRPDTSSASVLAVLESLAAEHKFKIQSREKFIAIFALPFEHLLSNIGTANHETLAALISVIGRLALDDVIGVKLASRSEFWRCSLQATERQVACEWRSLLYPLLGLMINVASHPGQVTQEHAVLASSRCLELLSDSQGGIITRAAGLLSVLLATSHAATQEVVQNGIVKRLLKILKNCIPISVSDQLPSWAAIQLTKFQVGGEMSSRYSIKALAVCTSSMPQACEELVKLDKRLHTLRKLLGSIDEVVVGNAALCIGHCLGAHEAASNLLGTDCVSLLLRHAGGDAKRTGVQQNAAITLGKLCKTEPRHIEKLRELHGLEILHSCVRLIT